ncbi:MAG: DNA-binding response regulator [Spirochaetes bacterium RBG_16_67_19]|nr:MAG: DNA-binding response regulator [Spirochaetes bacterium RBG_16_67_19]
MHQKILIADDEAGIRRLLRGYLEKAGFRVTEARNGKESLERCRAEKPDLLILDLMMPEMDGLDVFRAVRQESQVPIIMLSARAEETDRLVGLELGADDYVVKPFSPREVVARVRAVLRRSTQADRPVRALLQAGPIRLDMAKRTVTVDGEAKALTTAQFDILAALMLEPGRVFTRLQLLERIQGSAFEGYERTIDVHIKNIRRVLGDSSVKPRLIGTVRGVGYRLLEG